MKRRASTFTRRERRHGLAISHAPVFSNTMDYPTEKQAELIGIKLYTQAKNQKHCEAWAKTISKDNASIILARVLKLNRDMALNRPGQYTEIQNWGREQAKAMGYVEPQLNKSV